MTQQPFLSGWQRRALILSITLSAVGYVLFSMWSGWHDVRAAIGRIGAGGILLALSMSLVNYGLRFIRWQYYLHRLGHRVPLLPSLQVYLAGFALTTTPGKAGEALRSVLLQRWQVPYAQSLGALLSERLSDLIAAVLLALLGLSLYPPARPLILLGLVLIIIILVIISQHRWLSRLATVLERHPNRLLALIHHLCVMLLEARRCNSPGMLLFSTALSLVAWSAEALAFHWMLQWLGMEVSLTFSVFVYMTSMLAGALSFLPGGLGGTEATMTALLLWKGMSQAPAVAATILIRLATLWFAVALGGISLMLHREDADS